MKVPTRRQAIRDILVFQLKLFVDGFRDLLLSPISLIVGLLGVLADRQRPARAFHDVLEWGKRSERWINLFGALPRRRQLSASMAASRFKDMDDIVNDLERRIIEEHEQGHLSNKAKDTVDRSLSALHDAFRRSGRNRRDDGGIQ